jgi:hypothetical protein
MTSGGGYNPMRYDCKSRGCYNLNLRPKIETFAECFPRKIGMGDVDGIVEIGSKFLLVEWKSDGGLVTRGQEIMFERLTKDNEQFVVYVVEGNPVTMEIDEYTMYFNSSVQRFCCHDHDGLAELKGSFSSWAEWAEGKKS